MKKNSLGSFFAGMVAMLLLVCLTSSALAVTGKVTKELEYRNISVTLDGVKLDLRDAKGNAVEPFMFEGTNYLPVRALAESLGLEVAWDSANATVVLTTPKDESEDSEQLLFAKNSIRFYYVGIQKNEAGDYSVQLKIENDSDFTISALPRDLVVNSKSVEGSLSCKVEPGRTGNATLVLSGESLAKNEIEEPTRMTVRFDIFDANNWSNRFETGPISIGF